MPNNLELTVRLHPVSGEDVSVISADLGSEEEALDAVAQAMNERCSLVLRRATYNRETGEHTERHRRGPLAVSARVPDQGLNLGDGQSGTRQGAKTLTEPGPAEGPQLGPGWPGLGSP